MMTDSIFLPAIFLPSHVLLRIFLPASEPANGLAPGSISGGCSLAGASHGVALSSRWEGWLSG